jgi:RES domain-containing protein
VTLAWRIVKHSRATQAFSGEGARRYGGRWNRAGSPAVYLADSLALAALELFVHLGRAHAHLQLVTFRVEIPDAVPIDELAVGDLPGNWRAEPPPAETQDLGSRWLAGDNAALLRVPSAIVPEEHNLMLDPRHPDAGNLVIGLPRPFSLDPRMWK